MRERRTEMAGPCRFDYVLTAIEALGKYMDTAPHIVDTSDLIDRIHVAVHSLEDIEKIIKSDAPKKKNKKVFSTAVAEAHEHIAALRPDMLEAKKFFSIYNQDIKAIQSFSSDLAKMVRRTTEATVAIKKLDNRIDGMFRRLERELNVKITKPVEGITQAKATTKEKK